jgi:DNA invertase Pin-like site-specific DNA recombinase
MAPTPRSTRVIAYLRCSTRKQADEGMSLDVQRDRITAYAALYGLQVVAWEHDAASGKDLDRRGLRRALEGIDEGRADGIVVAKLDRLTRSVRDLGDLITERFGREDGPALLSVAEQIDTRTAGGRLVLNVLSSVSQWEREIISERTTEALDLKRANGERVSRHIPYGKQLAEDGMHVEPVPEDHPEYWLLVRARELRGQGLGLRRIAAKLAEEGFRTRLGTPFQTTQIARMLAP